MTDRENRIANAVQAWRDDHPGAGAALDRLPDDEKREALSRLGYSTRQHLELFGL